MKEVLAATGGDIDPAKIKALVATLSEVNIDEVLKTAPGITMAPTSPAAPAPEKEEKKEKEEEKKEAKKEEEALAGLGALFG